ncbi:hypothetical protein F4821DRAFT_241712 [Hypoxylon rubiginosum]|uniref:Uncharacterized protein n=1 Tax=Hypoxylon rubiginosum TaxID=110542 RepID=A0ACC0CXI6_9PEZI|nr:hypothetical protein F4821DRAFT_241712 [Hypoxylon rubiginosum]
MDPDAEFSFVLPASPQAFSPPEPVSGATLYDLEVARREKLRSRGRVATGCGEIDEAALLGGFERGSVVGVSAEDGDFGLLVGLQTAARAVVFGAAQRAAIITTLAAPVILPTLRDVIRVQVQAKLGPVVARQQQPAVVNAEVRRCLERVSVSRVFDVEGLWEVIGELETPLAPPVPATAPPLQGETTPPAIGDGDEDGNREALSSSPLSLLDSPSPPDSPSWEHAKAPAHHSPPSAQPRIEQAEVGDSEDDEDEELEFSQPSSSPLVQPPPPSLPPSPALPPLRPSIASPTPAPLPPPEKPIPTDEKPVREEEVVEAKDKVTTENHVPELILITHFSTLLTNLFTRAADNKASAHTTLQLLSSHLRSLARSSSASPLIILLNSTNAAASASTSTSTTNTTSGSIPSSGPGVQNRPLEPTLRSIFNSAPPSAAVAGAGNKRNKPAFGITFAQFLDLHLLCTRVPRTRKDAETLFAPPAGGTAREVRYGWVVEVLLDELGVWDGSSDDNDDGGGEGKGTGKETGQGMQSKIPERKRLNREQRWGAVDVRGGVVLVDLFPGARQQQPQVAKGPMRVAAGFGGPPSRGL